MRKYQKLFICFVLVLFIFSFVGAEKAHAITLEEIKAQITIIAAEIRELQISIITAKINELQKQLDELIKNETAIPVGTVEPFTIISPSDNEKLEVNKNYEIKWNGSSYLSDSKIEIKLLDDRYEQNSQDNSILLAETKNTGSYRK